MVGFSCYIVGETTLPIRCAELLLARGHEVLGVASFDPSVVRWAGEHGIRRIVPRRNLTAALGTKPFDFLFNIAGLTVLDDQVLAAAQGLAINFHDGPLPRYAGLNAPAWAILNGETEHGVTWHVMTSEIDEGDILLQRTFDITPFETAATLNAKCYEIGLQSFGELVDGLANGNLQRKPQDLHARSYFGRDRRPLGVGFLAWEKSADELTRLVRALDFGPYDNPLATVKLLTDCGIVIVREADVVAGPTNAPPGTIVGLSEAGMTVAASPGLVRLARFQTVAGWDLPIEELISRYGMALGRTLPVLGDDRLRTLEQHATNLARHERTWVRRLAEYDPIELPYASWDAGDEAREAPQTMTFEIPEAHFASLAQASDTGPRDDDVVAALSAFLARISGSRSFDIGFRDTSVEGVADDVEGLVSDIVPLRVEWKSDWSFTRFRHEVDRRLSGIRRTGSFLRDVPARYPEQRIGQIEFLVTVVAGGAFEASQAVPGRQLTAYVTGRRCTWVFDPHYLSPSAMAAMREQFLHLLAAVANDANVPITSIDPLGPAERHRVLASWNATAADYPRDRCVHELFEEQVARTPDAIALVWRDQLLSYRELNDRSNRLASYLRGRGAGPDVPVGIHMRRSTDMVIALLATLKAGSAYLPLDPDYPVERIGFMLKDSRAALVVTEAGIEATLPKAVEAVRVDAEGGAIARQDPSNAVSGAGPDNLAYVIYTSGSTGRPKGVMVRHRNVVNFFRGMDDVVEHDPPGTWVAVTSISFDISVLELFYTLSRGFRVVLHSEPDASEVHTAHPDVGIDFSLFYFASDEGSGREKYRLLIEGARFADEHGFTAVWTPERHFHAFGGLFPNPAVVGAGLATMTRHVGIRAGSCVSPLHDPIRIAEEWSVVDNLSGGRVGVSFAAGWQPNDFVLQPQNFEDRKELMFSQIREVQELWQGQAVTRRSPTGDEVSLAILPRPIQASLPVWVTAAGNPDTFRRAGAEGFNLLTHLLGQSVAELGEKLELYRKAWREAGHEGDGHVTLMLHTFVDEDPERAREQVREPLKDYLRGSVDLIRRAAWSFPTFKRMTTTDDGQFNLDALAPEEIDAVLDFSFERYFETSGLFGSPQQCIALVDSLKEVGVDEIACLIDYHSDTDAMLGQLPLLDRVRVAANPSTENEGTANEDGSVSALIERYHATHLQCTPSLATILASDAKAAKGLSGLRQLFIGGEAFPVALAERLASLVRGQLLNMYGPTETTIWSTTYHVNGEHNDMSIGRPIANTQVYVLDEQLQPVPVGIPGELFIGGDSVVKGYLDRPELTAQRFLPDPFRGQADARLYRTGDLVRYLPDGRLEFLGRIDQQVKIRGHRIELGEIEACLGEHPAVRESVVVARNGRQEQKTLVAYLVLRHKNDVDRAALREHLARRLPEFMVPSSFVTLDTLPLTPNGKVDRRALPAPERLHTTTVQGFVAPRDEMERRTSAIWESVLGVSPVGAHDNFFDLGGHSLLAAVLFAEIDRQLGVRLPMATLFGAPTVARLAEVLRSEADVALRS